MVDHGTPLLKVNQVREGVGKQMKNILGVKLAEFSTCAMERRLGSQYDFNEPLLEKLLQKWMNEKISEVVVSQFFYSQVGMLVRAGILLRSVSPTLTKG